MLSPACSTLGRDTIAPRMIDALPDLGDWQDTRRSLHAWSKVLSAVRGDQREPHPRWWHISLSVTPRGLSTGPLGDDPTSPAVELDLRRHELTIAVEGRPAGSLSLGDGPPAARLASWLRERLAADHEMAVQPGKAGRDAAERLYEPAAAQRYHAAVQGAAEILAQVRGDLEGSRGPVQLWAHHFDVAFELFGERTVESEGDSQPAQIGFGFFPGDDSDPRAYFYGTPWPFADDLVGTPLPAAARWQMEPWEGARLPYSAAVEDAAVVGDFFRAVHASGRSVLAE